MYNHQEDEDGASCIDALKLSSPDSSWVPAKQLIPPGRKSSIVICEDTSPCHQPFVFTASSLFKQRRSLSFNNLVDMAEQESKEEKDILLESSDDMFGLFSWSHSHHGRKKRSMDMAINTFSEHRRSSLLEKLQSLQESEVMFPVSKDQSPSISRVIDKKRDKESPEKLTKVKKSERKHLGGIRGKEKATPRTKDIHSLFTW